MSTIVCLMGEGLSTLLGHSCLGNWHYLAKLNTVYGQYQLVGGFMIYLLNAFPNAFLPMAGEEIKLRGVTEQEAREVLRQGFVSTIGHERTAELLSEKLGLEVKYNRIQVEYSPEDVYVIAAVVMRRLGEGERLTEEEILQLPIKWVVIGG